MLAALLGIVLVIVAVVLWVGAIGTAHAVAILIGVVGILLVLYWALPASAYSRRQ